MSTVSIGSRHLRYLSKKLHSGLRTQTIWKINYIVIHRFCDIIHTVSCAPGAKVNHVIPCLSIMRKSRGSFFIEHLNLIFFLSLIVTTFGKLILLSLKVLLTSFQSISRVSQIQFQFNLIFSGFIVPMILNKWILPAVLQSFMGT